MQRIKIFILSFMAMIASPFWAQTQENHDSLLITEDQFSEGRESTQLEWMASETYVTTASRKREHIQEAPANITVLTQAQIQQLGVGSLSEVLSFIPGITMIESHFGYTQVVFRGNYQEFNNKSLMLINGHPAWDVVHGSYHLEQVPVEAIKQIEIMRGPGSVLYGSNAYAGVVNIITYDGTEMDIGKGKATVKGGSFGTQEYSLSTGGQKGDFSFFASGSYVDNTGYDFHVKQDELGQSGTIDYENDYENAFLGMQYKELTFNYGYFNQDKEKVGLLPILLTGGKQHYENYFTDLEWLHSFSGQFTFQANFRYDRMRKDYDILTRDGGVASVPTDGIKYGGEIQLNYNLSEKITLTTGVSFDKYEGGVDWKSRTIESYLGDFTAYYDQNDAEEIAEYLNLNWKLLDNIELVGGLRYIDHSMSGGATAPNAGIIMGIGDKKYIKFLYGEAYRSPNLYETSVYVDGVAYANPDLDPETIKTYDLGLDLLFDNRYSVKINLFFLSTYDCIEGNPVLINGTGQNIWGIETELKTELSSDVSVFINGTANDGEMKETDLDVAYLIRYTANAGINWKIMDSLLLDLNMQYVGKREDNDTDYAAEAYTLFNVQGTYRITDEFKIRIILNNALDEEYVYPEFERGHIGDLGNGPGRAVYGKMEYQF